MTLPSSGTITLAQIAAEFSPVVGSPYQMASYRGVRWYQDNTATGLFSSTNLAFSDFYSKRYNTPVTPSSTTLSGSGSWTVVLYSALTIVGRGGGGGGGGGQGGNSGTLGGVGSAGTATTFGSSTWYVYAYPGQGGGNTSGSTGASGAGSDGSPAGGGGGSAGLAGYNNGGNGGAGGKTTLTVYNPISGSSPVGPAVGSSVSYSCGGGGSGGGGSSGFYCNPYPYCVSANGSNGGTGGAGYIQLSWS